jgi:hypothetical protein
VRTAGIFDQPPADAYDGDSGAGPSRYEFNIELDGKRADLQWNDCPEDPLGAHSAAPRAVVAGLDDLTSHSRKPACAY